MSAEISESEFKRQLQRGRIVESTEEMTERYEQMLRGLSVTVAYSETPLNFMLPAIQRAPTLEDRIQASAIFQDEIGHGHLEWRIAEDLGVDRREMIYEQPTDEFRCRYFLTCDVETWPEFVALLVTLDLGGGIMLGRDMANNTSYGPLRRAMKKIEKEERFHIRAGEMWLDRYAGKGGTATEKMQEAIDWAFFHGMEVFGPPDDLASGAVELTEYRLRGMTPDEYRQEWFREVIPMIEDAGLEVPVPYRYDEETDEYHVPEEYFPAHYDEEAREWRTGSDVTWDDVFERWSAADAANNIAPLRDQEPVVPGA